MVEIEREIDFSELEQRLKEVPLLQKDDSGNSVLPYRNAEISLQEFHYSEIQPTTLYVIRNNLRTQEELSERLAQLGQDPLGLAGGLDLVGKDGNRIGLLPPIVEEAPEGALLIDGIHRNFTSRILGRASFVGLFIRNTEPDCPVYAYPNDWEEIIQYDEAPTQPELKKRYRIDEPYKLYRDFSGFKMAGPRTNGSS